MKFELNFIEKESFIFVIMEYEDNEGGNILNIYSSLESARKELEDIAKNHSQKVIEDSVRVGVTTFIIEEYEVMKEYNNKPRIIKECERINE
jgi:DNA-binding PadR family transcriptional regulator